MLSIEFSPRGKEKGSFARGQCNVYEYANLGKEAPHRPGHNCRSRLMWRCLLWGKSPERQRILFICDYARRNICCVRSYSKIHDAIQRKEDEDSRGKRIQAYFYGLLLIFNRRRFVALLYRPPWLLRPDIGLILVCAASNWVFCLRATCPAPNDPGF